ncbi:MAG: tetratricopeptide repeat protein, partial [Gemmatimonadota bacterium]|nr:tetratricopeptide repeat protein [Gemmatimonadota bacterium]
MAVSTEERWKEHNETGRRHFERAEFAEAEQQYIAALRQATLLGAVTLTELGQVAFSLRDFTQSESYFRRALTIREQALGTESVDLMQALNDLAAPSYSRGELEQAERLYRRALAIGEAQLGELHPDLSVTLSNLARLHQRKADWRAAAPLLGRLLAIKQRSLGETHPHAVSLMLAVANARNSLGEHEVAEELVRRALALQERAQAGDAEMVRSLSMLSKIYMASGKTQLGGEIADKAAQRQKRVG